jgi:phage FluMu protein gp41
MLRGSIPVLSSDELDLYGVEFKDRENCIGVPDGQWAESVRQLARIEQRDLIRMRSNVRAMLDEALSYDAVAKRLRARVGVIDKEREVIQLARRSGAAAEP